MVKVRVAALTPAAGAVRDPFRYFQSRSVLSAAVETCWPTQSRGYAGPPVTSTVTTAPGATVRGEALPFTVRTGDEGRGRGVGVAVGRGVGVGVGVRVAVGVGVGPEGRQP